MKKKSVRSLALLVAAAMTGSTFFGTSIPVKAAAETWVSDEELEKNGTDAPEPDDVRPDANQYKYQKDELAAFCHFGPNTWSGYEWGFNQGNQKWLYEGMEPSEIFRLEKEFDAETLVTSLQEAGFKKLIITAKHHDGFCIWQSKYTDYDMGSVEYKGGKGDILAEISAACTEHNMDMGLYLSPWDVAEDSYGYKDANGNKTDKDHDVKDYNEYYNNQLEEILSSPQYGNDGHFVEVWMDGANGYTNNPQHYDFVKWFNTIQKYEGKEANYEADCMLFGAEAYTTVRWIGNENGTADKNTWSKSMVDKENNTIDSNRQGAHFVGLENGNQWTVPEADARITSGWFWSPSKNVPKTLEQLSSMYFNSVGHNATLLLNIPPNTDGTVDKAILDRVKEFGDNIKETFKTNMAAGEEADVKASAVRGNDSAFGPSTTVDGDDETYWTTDDNTNRGSLLINLGSSKKIDVISIEEAIQNGQRINEYKVEYRNGSGNWILLEEGETIGAKRLVRVPAVTATEVKITVATPTGKVPMISEIGVYKATEAFALAASAPAGMEVIDITDKDTSDGKGFTFNGTWTNQTGSEYVNQTNTWANPGSSFTLKFKGTKVYLVGTKDPNHGTAKIQIDDKEPVTVNTHAAARSTGQIWFSSDDLTDGEHTLTLTVGSAAIGIEAAYVINNGGVGMIGLETDEYTVNEDSTLNVKVKRVGGTRGRIKAMLSPNPGTAIQGDFETEPVVVTIPNGESEVTVPVVISRNENKTGDRAFTVELNSPSTDLILGFIDTATVNIIDAESMTKEQLQELVDSVDGWTKDLYTGDWNAFAAALASANELLKAASPDALEMGQAYTALSNAKAGLSKRTQFTADDLAVLPAKQGESLKVEAELFKLSNGTVHDFVINSNASYSNGQSVGWFANGNEMRLYYNALTTGTYTVTMRAASGRTAGNPNHIIISEEDNKVTRQTVNVTGTNANNPVYENTEFDIVVTTAGSGTLILTTDEKGGPDIDCFTITPKKIVSIFDVVTANADGGTVAADKATVTEGGSVVFTITPEPGYKISKVLVNDEETDVDIDPDTGVGTYTKSEVGEDLSVTAEFDLANYTEENRFEFPTKTNEDSKTLEAEYLVLDSSGAAKGKEIRVSATKDGSSNGKCIDYFEVGNKAYINYYAEKTGTYTVTLRYASGRAENNPNDITFREENGNITEVTESFTRLANDQYGTTWQEKTLEFVVAKPGAGVIELATAKGGPLLDKFDIVLTNETGALADELYKVDLEIAIQNAKKKLEASDTYTEESVAALQKALDSAELVFADLSATQAETDEKLKALGSAIDELVQPTFNITATVADGGGQIQASETTVERGGSVDFTITPDYGYVATKISVNGNEIESSSAEKTSFYGPNGTHSISNITEDQNVIVTFAQTGYTKDAPFKFPTDETSTTLEAEKFTLFNAGGLAEKWKLSVSESTWDGTAVTFINSLNNGDRISVPYEAEEAGDYDVTVYYRSGYASNRLTWNSEEDKIKAGSVAAGNQSSSVTRDTTFTVTVNQAGAGVWTFTAPSGNSPQIDRFVITKQDTPEPQTYEITASVNGGNGTVTPVSKAVEAGGEVTFTIKPEEGYEIADVTVNSTSVMNDVNTEAGTYTLSDINEAKTVVVTFKKIEEVQPDQYTEDNPFYFPTEVTGTVIALEAERFVLQDSGEGEAIRIADGTGWASNDKYVSDMNEGDQMVLYYHADKAGTYKVTMDYRSGNSENSINWAEASGKITAGFIDSVEHNPSSEELEVKHHEFTLTVTQAGDGVLTIGTGSAGAPQLDKFDIQLIEASGEVDPEEHTVTVDPTDSGFITVDKSTVEDGGSVSYTVTANSSYVIDTLTVNGQAVAAAAGKAFYDGIIENVNSNVTINAVFKAADPVQPENPDKTALWNALQEAYAILAQTDKYSAASLAEYKAVVDEVYAVYESGTAAADAIAQAIARLGEAKNLLAGAANPGMGGVGNPTTGTSSDTQKPSGSSTDNRKAVNTGDVSSPMLWIAVLAAACLAGGVVIRLRVNKSEKK